MSILKRGKAFQLRRRVPSRYRDVEPRSVIWVSLHTDSETIALSKADMTWQHLIEGWEAKRAGRSEDALSRHKAAMELARVRGFRYLDVDAVSQLPVSDVVRRVDAVGQVNGAPDKLAAAALLGTSSKPEILLSEALELYWSLARDKVIGKNPDKIRW